MANPSKHEEIMKSLGGIEEHLKTLNGSVAKNVRDIAKLRDSQTKDDLIKERVRGGWMVLAWMGGAALAIGTLLSKFIER
uniref:Uncharacterized protein n=1 Tax=viral metagenome TaxID=1070528 RepID=A0A6M3Y4F0_9ZZZZ